MKRLDRTRSALVIALVLVVGALAARPTEAQLPLEFSPGSSELSREELTLLLEEYERALESPAYSDRIKQDLRFSVARVRSRLTQGDFQAGDRIALSVVGQPQVPDTVTVDPGPRINLPVFGAIPLEGVLRSEISDHLAEYLGRMIRNPDVTAESLMRVSIQGAVGNPGFYVLPASALVSDAVMLAGGPAPNAELDKLRIERATRLLYGGEELQVAMAAGRTLDQLSLQAGDQFMLPEEKNSIWRSVGRYAFVIGSMLLLGVGAGAAGF